MRRPNRSEAVNIGSGDHIPTFRTLGIFVGGTGNLVLRFRNDSADSTYTALAANTLIEGDIIAVRQIGTTATNMRLLGEKG